MEIQQYIDEMKELQEHVLNYLNDEENIYDLTSSFNDYKISNDKHLLKSILHLLVKIANNHHRLFNFFG